MNALRRWSLTLLPLAWLAGGPACAGTIYKCTARGMAVAYQSTPCGSDDAERRVARFAGLPDAMAPPALPADSATVPRAKDGPWPRRPIALGMTDDEVLNMPAWGRPERIVRSRLARGWQEVWSYPDAWGAERLLVFSNGRLADIVDVPRARLAQRTD